MYLIGNTENNITPQKEVKPNNYRIYSINSGNQDDWSAMHSIVEIEGDKLSFKVGGYFDDLTVTFIDGVQKTFSEIADVTVPHADTDINYKAFINKNGEIELYSENEVNRVAVGGTRIEMLLQNPPPDLRNAVYIDQSQYPFRAFKISSNYTLSDWSDKVFLFTLFVNSNNTIEQYWVESYVDSFNFPFSSSSNLNPNNIAGFFEQRTETDENGNFYAELATTSGFLMKYGKTTVAANDTYESPMGNWFNPQNIFWTDTKNSNVTVEVPENNSGVVQITNETNEEQYVEWKIEGLGV